MWEIWEEIRANFLLDRKRFMKTIYCRNKRSEFIFPHISNRGISLTIDDILDSRGNSRNRAKYRPYPEKISQQNRKKPGHIYEKNRLYNIRHKTSFYRILSKWSKIESRKYIFLDLSDRNTDHRISRTSTIWHIEFWIVWNILEWCRKIREFRKYRDIFSLITFIKFSNLENCLKSLGIRGIRSFRQFSNIVFEIFLWKNLKCSDIHNSSQDEDNSCDKRNSIGKWHEIW